MMPALHTPRMSNHVGGEAAVDKQLGWQLRLLLSLEERERTRTRLLVTEVVAAIITDIVNVIPGKVSHQQHPQPAQMAATSCAFQFRCLGQRPMFVPTEYQQSPQYFPASSILLPTRLHALATQVARIEIRVVGTRALAAPTVDTTTGTSGCSGRKRYRRAAPAAATSTPNYRKPSLYVSASWNGDYAASVNLSPYVDDSLAMPALHAVTDNSDDAHFGGRNREASRLIILPMYVPWIMKGSADSDGSCMNHAGDGRGSRKKGFHGLGGGGGDGFDGSDGCHGGKEGRSHRLQVVVSAKVPESCDRIESDILGNIYHGDSEGGRTSPSSHPMALPSESVNELTELDLFERDLLRSEWTEVLVPVCTNTPESSALQGSRTPPWEKQEERRRRNDCPPDHAVVLQVRSAGFHPPAPPTWVVRRDFAERAVSRILAAAAAAVVQPRVEMNLLGLRGAIESLLPERASAENSYVENAATQAAGSSLAKHEGETIDKPYDEIHCEAFWNGSLVYTAQLCRAAPSLPPAAEEHKEGTPRCSLRGEALAIQAGTCFGESKETEEFRPSDRKAEKDENIEEKVAELTRVELDHPRDSDPSTWFSGGGVDGGGDGGDENDRLERDWMTLDGGLTDAADSQRLPNTKRDENTLHEGEAGCKGTEQMSAIERKKMESSAQPLAWVPAEGDVYGSRPFRFFLPACLIDNAAGGQTYDARGGSIANLGDIDVDSDSVDGSSSIDDGDIVGVGRVQGDLRLVFWATSSSSGQGPTSRFITKQRQSSLSLPYGDTDADCSTSDRGRAVAAAAARRGRRKEEKDRRLLGWATLVDDELLLQPRGQRIELALSAKTGLDFSTAWSMAHDLKRCAISCQERK